MREKWARRIVLFTGSLVLLLAIAFADIQNPIESGDITGSKKLILPLEHQESTVLDPECVEAGRKVYKQQSCARCHAIAGEGNRRYPLDGVGTSRTAEELRDWIAGADVLQGELLERIRKSKQTYRKLPGDDLDSLVIYMQSLRR